MCFASKLTIYFKLKEQISMASRYCYLNGIYLFIAVKLSVISKHFLRNLVIMGGLPGDISENPVYVGEAKEGLEYEL